MIGQAKRLAELNKLYGMVPERKFNCPLITIASGKGGTGKSFFSLNIAMTLAQVGKKILLLDLDKNLSNIHIMLNKTPSETIYHFLTNKSLINDLVTTVDSNLDCIFGDSGKTDHPELSDNNLDKLFYQLAQLSNKYDYILVDTGSGIGNDLKYILKNSSTVIIVTNPEPTSIMDSYVVLKEMKNLNYDKQKFVLINKSIDPGTGSEAFRNLEKAAKHFLDYNILSLGFISNDLEVSKSIINQIPIMSNKTEVRCKAEFRNIANKLINNTQMENNNH